MPQRLAERVLLIGWDAADWNVITPLLDAGKMPSLQALIERGVMGNLATLDPPFSPMLWTSVATGHTADRHGIVHFVQPSDDGTSAEPVLGSSRAVKALWNILSQEGLRSNVVGWWPSHPAEPIDGAMVTNFFHPATAPAHEAWIAPPGTVHPPELEAELLKLRVHPAELTANHVRPFIEGLETIDQEADPRPAAIAKILADAATVQAAATYLMDTQPWDFTAVYFDAIDHFCHGFMRFHPPQMAGVSDEDFAHYRNVVDASYMFHDMMLGRLLDLAGDDCTVMLISDHGFHSDHRRPQVVPRHVPAGAAVEHRSFGVIAMAGPGIRRDERINGASLLNIAPTVLTLFGLPYGADMAAAPLVQAFEDVPELETVPSWESVGPPHGSTAGPSAADPWSKQEAMRQLVALGYVDPDAVVGGGEGAARDAAFNLGRVYLSTGRPAEAIPHFEQAYRAESPHRDYYGLSLVEAHLDAGQIDAARRLAGELRKAETRFPNALALLQSDIEAAAGNDDASLAMLDALNVDAASPEVRLRRGHLLLRLGKLEQAGEEYAEVLDVDPDNARAYNGLATVRIGQKRYGEAADLALEAVARLYYFPDAHFHLGVAMLKQGWAERAESALKVAVRQRPRFALAHHWLARIYQDYLEDRPRSRQHYGAYQALTAAGAPDNESS